ncbi:hypothetical protein [Aquimarina latercula]|uniref:hypothetical protein n=1 Tax=Aquimarina latercula TaxID=987 RepID=UPI000415EF22|nr:hypothetical protein [Aquimarina latercula]
MNYSKKYNYLDFREFLQYPYYQKIARLSSAKRLLEYQVEFIDIYSKYIPLYPSVKCERLEFLYLCYRTVQAMDEKLFQDFVNFNWRGIVWACWTGCITPYPKSYMIEQLKEIEDDLPYNKWLIETAVNILSGKSKDDELYKYISKLKYFIGLMPRVEIPLRPLPSEKQLHNQEIFRNRLKTIYQTKGTNEAIIFFQKNKSSIYDVSYKEWLRNISKIK